MNPSRLHWRSFLLPKAGHAYDECEDSIDGDPETGRFAIADGAAESYAAGEWARLLTAAFVANGPEGDWLAGPRDEWKTMAAGTAVSWYAEDKFARGGHATFLGVSVRPTTDGVEWDAIATGDSCLVLVRDGSLGLSFPLERSADFSTAPTLITSRTGLPAWRTLHGVLLPGEHLLLTTDALAQFLLTTAEDGDFAGSALTELEDEDDFAFWAAMLRDQGRLRNDDGALGVVEVHG